VSWSAEKYIFLNQYLLFLKNGTLKTPQSSQILDVNELSSYQKIYIGCTTHRFEEFEILKK
jgi:hypothetical protein